MNEEPTIAAVEKYTAEDLSARRWGVVALLFAGGGLAILGYMLAPSALNIASLALIAAGISVTLAGVAARPWLTGEVQSRTFRPDREQF